MNFTRGLKVYAHQHLIGAILDLILLLLLWEVAQKWPKIRPATFCFFNWLGLHNDNFCTSSLQHDTNLRLSAVFAQTSLNTKIQLRKLIATWYRTKIQPNSQDFFLSPAPPNPWQRVCILEAEMKSSFLFAVGDLSSRLIIVTALPDTKILGVV